MKKIVTFLVMFLMTGGILMAQSFRYQAVLRDSQNHLVAGEAGTVTFSVGDITWEDMDFTTNQNGLVSLILEDNEDVNWSNAVLKAVFTFTNDQIPQIVVETPVTAVPYALGAGDVTLTTDAIVNYLNNGDADHLTNEADWAEIYGAMKANPGHNNLRDSVVEYIKANKNVAKDVILAYITQVTAQDITDAYDSALNVSDEVKAAFYENLKDYFINHRELIVDVAEYFIRTATAKEINDVYNDLKNSPAALEAQRILKRHFEAYLRNNGYICENGVTLCDVVATLNALNECPNLNNFTVTPSKDNNQFILTFANSNSNNNNVDYVSKINNVDVTVNYKDINDSDQSESYTGLTLNNDKKVSVQLPDDYNGGAFVYECSIKIVGCSNALTSENNQFSGQ